jgi:hypothetical protein
MISNNNQIEFTIKTIYSCHCLDYRDTILALKASGVSISTISGASRFQSRTVLGKNDIFLVSIREDGIWNDLGRCVLIWFFGVMCRTNHVVFPWRPRTSRLMVSLLDSYPPLVKHSICGILHEYI